MKYKIKHETKKKINEIIAAAENKDENLFRLLMQEVDKRADRIKVNLQLNEGPQI